MKWNVVVISCLVRSCCWFLGLSVFVLSIYCWLMLIVIFILISGWNRWFLILVGRKVWCWVMDFIFMKKDYWIRLFVLIWWWLVFIIFFRLLMGMFIWVWDGIWCIWKCCLIWWVVLSCIILFFLVMMICLCSKWWERRIWYWKWIWKCLCLVIWSIFGLIGFVKSVVILL